MHFELCEPYKLGFDFAFPPKQSQQSPLQKDAASHSGAGPSCLLLYTEFEEYQNCWMTFFE